MSSEGIELNQSKAEAIKSWPTTTSIIEVRSFHGLTSFYRRFIKDFSSTMAPLTECTKKGSFEWTKATQRAFETIKDRLCSTPILVVPNFYVLFEFECDANGIGIGLILTQLSSL